MVPSRNATVEIESSGSQITPMTVGCGDDYGRKVACLFERLARLYFGEI